MNQASTINTINKKNQKIKNWSIEAFSIIAIGYLIFSLASPMFIKGEQRSPERIGNSEIALIVIILLFNSGLLNRLEDFAVENGSIKAKFQELKEEVDEQKKQIDELQSQQLEQLEQQQKILEGTQLNLEQNQAFMYSLLLGEKDYEKIDRLNYHSKAGTRYEFHVSEKVGDELRRLRDLKLISMKSGYIQYLIQLSDNGKRPIDLAEYCEVTDLGKKFLETREKIQVENYQKFNVLQSNEEVENTSTTA